MTSRLQECPQLSPQVPRPWWAFQTPRFHIGQTHSLTIAKTIWFWVRTWGWQYTLTGSARPLNGPFEYICYPCSTDPAGKSWSVDHTLQELTHNQRWRHWRNQYLGTSKNADFLQSSLNKSTAQISVTAESVVDSAEQFEFRPIRSSKFQINQPVAFKIQIVQLILMY